MKILIDHLKLTDAPYDHDSDFYINSDEEVTNRLTKELINVKSTCILVSGYRGSGKTSFINRIGKKILESSENIVIVKLNISKFEPLSYTLRKMIRESFLAIPEEKLKEIRISNPLVLKQLELLFERTFSEVVDTSRYSVKNDVNKTLNITINMKKLLGFIIGLILLGINTKIDFLGYFTKLNSMISDIINWAAFIIVGIWATIEGIRYEYKLQKNESLLEEISRKTLYDDEIAEFQFLKIIKELKKTGLKFIYVLDELDKIENDAELEKMIGELKPILLSGSASFILISGQKLFYKYNHSQTIDDSVISSMFSQTIHIRLTSTPEFFDMFEILSKKTNYDQEIYESYLNSLILRSNKIPRRFINLLRQDLSWEKEGSSAYIEVDNKKYKFYKTDSELLAIINKIEESGISGSSYSDGIKDYFLTHLHIWIQRMKSYVDIYFTKEEILGEPQILEENYSSYNKQLKGLLDILLDSIVDVGLLEIKTENSTEDGTILYRWADRANVIEPSSNEKGEVTSNFLLSFIDLEKYVRYLYSLLIDRDNRSLNQMVQRLVEEKYLPEKWVKNKRFQDIFNVRNKLVHGVSLKHEELDIVLNLRIELNRMTSELLEVFTYNLAKKTLIGYNYNLILGNGNSYNNQIDIIAIAHSNLPDILIEVKRHLNGESLRSLMQNIPKLLNNHNKMTSKENHLIICFYAEGTNSNSSSRLKRHQEEIKLQHPSLKDNIHFLFLGSNDVEDNAKCIEDYLKQLLKNQ
ncbi:P-loop NTPase fold protein [Brevibacillus sp. TJ4]|uniref:P-loop NTPase fold protein n=1 Tax=Brevibacillus sp. TJ4 TaxID=3234853 RepID=UPI0037D51097